MNRSPILTLLMVLGGIILLLPGVCAVVFMTAGGMYGDSTLTLLWLVCLAISASGVFLIVKAFR
jgi:hypothetical protein